MLRMQPHSQEFLWGLAVATPVVKKGVLEGASSNPFLDQSCLEGVSSPFL